MCCLGPTTKKAASSPSFMTQNESRFTRPAFRFPASRFPRPAFCSPASRFPLAPSPLPSTSRFRVPLFAFICFPLRTFRFPLSFLPPPVDFRFPLPPPASLCFPLPTASHFALAASHSVSSVPAAPRFPLQPSRLLPATCFPLPATRPRSRCFPPPDAPYPLLLALTPHFPLLPTSHIPHSRFPLPASRIPLPAFRCLLREACSRRGDREREKRPFREEMRRKGREWERIPFTE
ncbi:hypothetical protein CLOM_g22048 [Closterium sp. NIES-68]|nr:hypothetical protein CLOM_g22048 [Closterium sp. NIES-68]GJP77764.1 hypothetical protein CLOP_g8115 [Closterium sp. NIES-67]